VVDKLNQLQQLILHACITQIVVIWDSFC